MFEALKDSKTFQNQPKLPRLPIPPLEDTARRYLRALQGLQDPDEHEQTKQAVEDFLNGDGPRIQQKLIEYAADKPSYIEEFWYESYLLHSDPVVLSLNPFFILECVLTLSTLLFEAMFTDYISLLVTVDTLHANLPHPETTPHRPGVLKSSAPHPSYSPLSHSSMI